MRIGLISDTHGVLRPEVFDIFAGVDRILHAGDIGPLEILIELEAIAPVTAVRGNTDRADIWPRAPEVVISELAGWRTVVVHGDRFGTPTPAILRAAYPDAKIIVYGHTHRPVLNRVGESLVINPGAAGPRRFSLRPSVGLMTLTAAGVQAEIVEI